MRWLRRLIRRYMKPMHEYDAMRWKHRLSLFYVFCAWNTLGVVGYYIYSGKADWAHYYGLKTDEEKDKRPGLYYAELLEVKKAQIIQLKGLTLSEPYEYEAPETKKKH